MPTPSPTPSNETARRTLGGPGGRVLLIAYDFPPSLAMGAQACAQIARYLGEYGWDPVVLTVEPRFLSACDPTTVGIFSGKVVRTAVLPHPLRMYARLRSASARGSGPPGVPGRPNGPETIGAPPVAPNGAGGSVSSLKRWVRALLEIPDDATGWLPIAIARGRWLIQREHITAILSSAPYWTNHVVGLALKRLTGLPWTAHFRDPWVGSKGQDRSRIGELAGAVDRRLERMVVDRADWVVCVTDRHTEAMRRGYHSLPAEKFVTVPNGYAVEEFDHLSPVGPDPARDEPGQFAITYTGELYIGRDVTPILRALRRLIDEEEFGPGDVVLNLVGECQMSRGRPVRSIARDLGLEDVVRLHGQVSRAEALRFMVASDLLLLLAEGLTLQVPGKTYEYLRAGRPVLALAPEGATADLVRTTRAGEVVRPDDVDGIADILSRAVRVKRGGHTPAGADPLLVQQYDRLALTGRFASLLGVAGPGRPK